MAAPWTPKSVPGLPYGSPGDPRGNVPGYSYPDIYPPSGITPETVPELEELAPPGQGNVDFLLELNKLPPGGDFSGSGSPTFPVYPNNPIDYSAPWNVGPYEGYMQYDEPGGPQWPSMLDEDLIDQERILGIPHNVTQNPGVAPMPTSALAASQQFLGTPPGFNALYDLGPFPIRNIGTSMGYQ